MEIPMPTPDNDPDQEKKRHEQELNIWRRIAFASGLFQGDVTARTLLESLPVGCVILDDTGTILLINNCTEQMFGYVKEDLVGKPHAVLIPERFRKVHEEHMARFFAEPATRPMNHSLDVTGCRRDESEFPVEIDLSSIETVNGVHFLAFISDITLRKQFERRLRESEELFHLQIEQVRDYAIFTIDPQGIVLNWNVGAERLKGYRTEEIIGRHFSCFYTEEDRNAGKPEAEIKKAAGEGQVADEGWRIRKDGSRFWADGLITALHDESGNLLGFSKVTHDITERKLTEEALYKAQQVFRTLVENSPDIITRYDRDCRRTYVNPMFLKATQIPQQELLGTEPMKCSPLPAASAEVLQNLLRRVLDSGVAQTVDVIWPKADNIDRWYNVYAFPECDCDGRVMSVMTVSRDITERKQMEQEITRLASFPMLSPHPVVELDMNGRITFINPTAERLFPDLKLQGLSHPYLEDWELLSSSLRCGTKPNDRMVSVGGCWYQQTMYYMPEKLLRIYGFDITERKLAEEALRESEQKYRQLNETLEQRIKEAVEELQEINKMLIIQGRQAVMGEMIGNIAHQWRQPLNMLGLIAQELPAIYKRGEFSPEYLDANVRKIMESIQQMSKTIDDFRAFFQTDKVMVNFKVHEMIEKTISLLEAGLKASGIRIEIEVTDDISINGYPNEFAQVLLNIVNNARDALLERKADNPAITIRSWNEGGKVVVTVSDNAGGIPEGIMDKVFEPYFTTKGPDKGTGIGLYMSTTIIEKHMNGRLSVRNAGDGAEFRIEI
jgi:PAS domain S-box-containing protein